MPNITTSELIPGNEYDRPYLADLWSYKGWAGLSKGIIVPSNTNKIIFFITMQKQNSSTQYRDFFEGNILHIDGETNHASDDKIISSSFNGTELLLFFRYKHHSPFVFYGQMELIDYSKSKDKAPSRFSFATNRIEVEQTRKKTELES